MNRIDRLLGVLTTIQSKKFVTAESIAEKYTISVRTVYRDIKALIEIGVPIHFENGRGYQILKSYFLPPVSLSSEEANALILITSLADKYSDHNTKKNVESAVAKIKSVMQPQEREQANILQDQIRIYQNQMEYSEHLSIIQKAIIEKTILCISYINNENIISQREIEPIGLSFYSEQWHLIAWCWLRNAYRDFKIKQIQEMKSLKQVFRKTDHYSISDYLDSLS